LTLKVQKRHVAGNIRVIIIESTACESIRVANQHEMRTGEVLVKV
jgi:hypothetical protein